MNFIIFKGINSKDINGLIISELPSITKPKMRTTITKIDGKNGDIVEYLGYESYTKTLNIGLSYNYDINKIIEFFNGSGDLILSNEDDKIYKAHVLEQIDFERLVRFKTATVKFHVQPYKYLYKEEPKIFEINEEKEILVENKGLEKSEPIITLYGSGNVSIMINNFNIFQINIDDEYVIIDSTQQEAYKNNVLKNRLMIGDFPQLQPGENVITWTGTLTKIIVEPKSRWL